MNKQWNYSYTVNYQDCNLDFKTYPLKMTILSTTFMLLYVGMRVFHDEKFHIAK